MNRELEHDLFYGDEFTDFVSVPMRLLRRCGRPFLLLPAGSRLAARGLALYPAPTRAARASKALLRLVLQFGFPLGLKKTALNIAPDNSFAKFLTETGGTASLLSKTSDLKSSASTGVAVWFSTGAEENCAEHRARQLVCEVSHGDRRNRLFAVKNF